MPAASMSAAPMLVMLVALMPASMPVASMSVVGLVGHDVGGGPGRIVARIDVGALVSALTFVF